MHIHHPYVVEHHSGLQLQYLGQKDQFENFLLVTIRRTSANRKSILSRWNSGMLRMSVAMQRKLRTLSFKLHKDTMTEVAEDSVIRKV